MLKYLIEIKKMFFDDYFIINTLAKKVKEAQETNDLKKQKILKGFTRLLSIFENIYIIMKDYDDSEEFDEIKTFYSYIAQITTRYLENYIRGEKFDLNKIKFILESLVYKYAFFGFTLYEGKHYLLMDKCFMEENEKKEDNKILEIPIPITKTDAWYNDLKNINS